MMDPIKTVLVIEDDEDCRYVYGEFLRFAGYDAIEKANAEDALLFLAQGQRISLVILDLTLPGMEPQDFLRHFREERRHAHTPVLVLSGRHDIEERASALGAAAHLKKPFDLVPLTEIVEKLIRNAQPE